jgi:hypothetical protein
MANFRFVKIKEKQKLICRADGSLAIFTSVFLQISFCFSFIFTNRKFAMSALRDARQTARGHTKGRHGKLPICKNKGKTKANLQENGGVQCPSKCEVPG